jgi:hypothetical protein
MKRLEIVSYTYKPRLTEADLRSLTKIVLERGTNPSIVAHYERLDGRGGILVQEVAAEDALEADYERTLAYGPYMDFELMMVTPIEDAVPTILKLYG